MTHPQAILVLPHLRIQNANAIASPLTHGFPSITAFTGLMWALERKLAQAGLPLRLQGVGVVCHHHQEQVTQGYVGSFNLTRNPVDKDGSTAAIVEEGRMHLQITLVLAVSEKRMPGMQAALVQANQAQLDGWATQAGHILAGMRVAGGSVLPSRPVPGRRVRPWMAIVPEEPAAAAMAFRGWSRQWLPGFALVGRDDLLAARLQHLRTTQPDATLLDAWLHASRFNHQPLSNMEGTDAPNDKVRWGDPLRSQGSGWVVPVPVGYAALTSGAHAPGTVRNARDTAVPLRFVESVYSLGEWIGPHRLTGLHQLLWHVETDETRGLYRCRNGYRPQSANDDTSANVGNPTGTLDVWDDTEAYDYT
ncbi:type I-F CRISPR-associated protein Csy2 [Paracidovorax cattleyae]|uniref:CRISPR-associated protein, Csy2 family n=1 Tax=Paracidovorax cattleyae TaxID=80868 RepID=A0A1H0WHQ7_9BURK|nr:type I-F CRISPR-associated protein Csy2 [Paracidovorax cattleyae]MBF9263191.1 type I-F CRISPR-associated protein Csy2 [Paracidovorax cattleyae]SDP90081.1 CRISPR-associated protein, Csy2 family [Paracidovorax cattleyae]